MGKRFSAIIALALCTSLGGCAGEDLGTVAVMGPAAAHPQVASGDAQPSVWVRDCAKDIAAIEQDISALEAFTGPYMPDSVLDPLNRIEMRIANGATFAGLMENVHPDAEVRDAASTCTTAYSDLSTRLSLSHAIYQAVRKTDVSNTADDTQRYHFLTLQTFTLAGVDRDAETRARIRELNDRITRLGQAFDRNILEDVRYIEVAPEELDGLPADFIAAKDTTEDGKIRISTRYVDTVPIYTYAHSDDLRRRLREVDQSRAYPQNAAVLKELLEQRHELASLLGFDSYADLITRDKMIGSADNALAFINRIHTLAQPAAQRDVARFLARLQEMDPDATRVERWQTFYLEELIRREEYQVDANELRQYFPYSQVRDGIFGLVEHLFDVRIRPWQTDTWHPSVKAYEMYQGSDLIGRFFLDMHPRAGKYQHAAAFINTVGVEDVQIPTSTLVCNFAGGDDPNGLMEYSEVRTFLHEFGHLIHSLFGGHQRYVRLSGIATEWDFVEAPSQMLEEWMYDEETLRTFAINAAGEAIPGDLVARLRAARDFGDGATTAVQMYYAALSLQYHRLAPDTFELLDKMVELETTYSPFPHQKNTYFFANLGHLNGYSAIYYTYMWSKVIAVDMFSEFEEQGLRDKRTARRYRDRILTPGGSRPAAQLVEDFLGRPYSFDAFAKRLSED
ncbi:MAG: M3 family metallopeptidase [Porticoccaceae bacterium]